MSSPRVAVVHEWISAAGGSEQVFEEIAAAFPEAELWSLWNDRGPLADGRPVHESWLARTPLRGRKAAALPIMPLVWSTLGRRHEYDVVLSSSHCMAHGVRFSARSRPTYLSYVHAPMRYVWSPELDHRGRVSTAARVAVGPVKAVDRLLTRHVSAFAANAHEVRRRMQEYWDRTADVIYPPVDTEFFRPSADSSLPFPSYVLGAGRWIPYKNFDIVITAAAKAGVPLVIAGSGPEEQRLREAAADAGIPVHFELRPSRERLRDLYTGASAFVFPVHEDFGIVPVEAMLCGTPVVGLARGGLLETVEHGTTGWLAEDLDADELARGITAALDLHGDLLRATCLRFSTDRFHHEIRDWVGTHS